MTWIILCMKIMLYQRAHSSEKLPAEMNLANFQAEDGIMCFLH